MLYSLQTAHSVLSVCQLWLEQARCHSALHFAAIIAVIRNSTVNLVSKLASEAEGQAMSTPAATATAAGDASSGAASSSRLARAEKLDRQRYIEHVSMNGLKL